MVKQLRIISNKLKFVSGKNETSRKLQFWLIILNLGQATLWTNSKKRNRQESQIQERPLQLLVPRLQICTPQNVQYEQAVLQQGMERYQSLFAAQGLH